MTDKTQALQRLLDRAEKSFTCKSGCNDCCGVVPFSDIEKARASALKPMEAWERYQGSAWLLKSALANFSCPFSDKNNGCQIYDVRPMVCRLFGVVDHEMMKCPHGSAPKKMITEAQSRALISGEPL